MRQADSSDLREQTANQMYEIYQDLCRDQNGAIKAFLSSRGLTPSLGRRHPSLVMEYFVGELGVEVTPYQFHQTVMEFNSINALVRSFGLGVLVLLPKEAIGWYDILLHGYNLV